MSQSHVYLVFDRYKDYSTKRNITKERLSQFRRSHNLSLSSPLQAKEIAMRVADTKQQLIEIGRNDLIKNIPAKSNKRIITAQGVHIIRDGGSYNKR